ncbi:hypothetical protein KQX54_013380 [Cotesia glomerata]|uniref:Dynein heavy chain hydrolytic ATP-binding dynein motor region domain-containing protein n=1 Tax=Cotesia glomerata TaxID=32391 RepID=A0AAV7IH55_COTGL|nr:hypothetical protein KQX54_013380 [Cotesia glomerata]
MQITLASSLAKAMSNITQFKDETVLDSAQSQSSDKSILERIRAQVERDSECSSRFSSAGTITFKEEEIKTSIAKNFPEQENLIQSLCEKKFPKLVAEDILLLFSLFNNVFPNAYYMRVEIKGLKDQVRNVCAKEYLVREESGDEQGGT